MRFVSPEAGVLVQGITGRVGRRHALLMRHYGTRIVAGVSPSAHEPQVDGIPLYRSCAEAVHATGARASVIMAPPLAVLPALRDAIAAGIELVVSVAEGVPVADAVMARNEALAAGVRWVGASTPGLAIPGMLKLGFLPDVALAPGPLGIMAKSGTLSYEICHRLVQRGLGQTLWVGVGGDAVKGTRFADLVPHFAADSATRAVVVIGEIGGSEEEELAAALTERRFGKPVYALIAGKAAREGVTMGHAGALVFGDIGTVQAKINALTRAGARVFTRIQDLVDAVAAGLRHQAS
jgi:succinyl-CoA synthetase alpha subunit